jgi:hypothetical protein
MKHSWSMGQKDAVNAGSRHARFKLSFHFIPYSVQVPEEIRKRQWKDLVKLQFALCVESPPLRDSVVALFCAIFGHAYFARVLYLQTLHPFSNSNFARLRERPNLRNIARWLISLRDFPSRSENDAEMQFWVMCCARELELFVAV